MRTFIAVVTGLAITGLLVFIGDSSFAHASDTTIIPGYAGTSRLTELIALMWTTFSIGIGAAVTIRIRNSKEAVAGFIVGELFFGAGLLHQFWGARTWYTVVAVLLVVPGALLGAWIGSHGRSGVTSHA
jgi:hypothetical protein